MVLFSPVLSDPFSLAFFTVEQLTYFSIISAYSQNEASIETLNHKINVVCSSLRTQASGHLERRYKISVVSKDIPTQIKQLIRSNVQLLWHNSQRLKHVKCCPRCYALQNIDRAYIVEKIS